MLRVAGVSSYSIVDGPGIRVVVYFQGCHHHCPGCHNPQTWDPRGGTEVTPGQLIDRVYAKLNPLVTGVTLSGGEPLDQPGPELLQVVKAIVDPGHLNLMIYTGLTIDELNQATETDPSIKAIVDMAHYLKTGPYVEALRDTTLRWRGSTNQTLWTQTPEGWGRIED